MTQKHTVCPVDELPPGRRKIVEIAGKSIGIFNVDGQFYALKNVCPHQGAKLCEGTITGQVSSSRAGDFELRRNGHVIRCPWHKWEFDIETGRALFNPERWLSKTYETSIEHSNEAGGGGVKDIDEERCSGKPSSVEQFQVSIDQDFVVVHV